MTFIVTTAPGTTPTASDIQPSLTDTAQEFIRTHAARFQGLVDAVAEMVWIADAEGNPSDASQWQAYSGQTAEQTAQEGWASCIHPADRATMLKAWRESMSAGKPFEAYARFRRYDGEYRWFRIHAQPLRDADGRIREWIGISTDVDAHHRTEEQLRSLTERLLAVIRLQTAIANSTPDPEAIQRLVAEAGRSLVNADIAAVGYPDGKVVRYPKMAGCARDVLHVPLAGSITGWCVERREPVRSDDLRTDPRAWETARVDLDMRSGLWVPLVHGNEVMGVLTALSRRASAFGEDDLQTLSLLAGILATALANARAATLRAEALRTLEFQAKLLASVEQAVLAADLRGHLTYWNAYAEQLFGWPADEVLGQPARDFIIPPDKRDVSQVLGDRIRNGESYQGSFEYLRKDGTRFTGHNTTTLVHDAQGNAIGMIAVCRDITKELALEEQLRHSQKMQAVGQLAGGVAHDFNNLLTAISSYAELVHEAVTDEQLRADIAEIRKAAARGADLTRQMLAFSRKQLVQPVVFDAGEAVRDLENMLRRLISERIDLDITCDSAPLAVDADRTQFEQVVLNLVVNARDAIDGVGRIRIRVAHEEGTGPHGRLLLEVADTGCGMTPDTVSRMFEPFFTTKPAGKGTGLGLSVVHGIVEHLHGSIGVDSTPGAGTRFSIRLPLSAVTDAQPLPPADAAAELTRGERVLLVEDNAALLTLCQRVLARHGYEVLASASAETAIAAARGRAFDLVITDMVMPDMHGGMLVEKLADAGIMAPVLYMSGYTEEDVLNFEPGRGRSSFLPKPFTPRQLLEEVRKLLERDRRLRKSSA